MTTILIVGGTAAELLLRMNTNEEGMLSREDIKKAGNAFHKILQDTGLIQKEDYVLRMTRRKGNVFVLHRVRSGSGVITTDLTDDVTKQLDALIGQTFVQCGSRDYCFLMMWEKGRLEQLNFHTHDDAATH